jgi:hypothetical protein
VAPLVIDTPVLPLVEVAAEVSFTDQGAADTHTAVLDWGDGTTDDPAALVEPSGAAPGLVSGVHAFSEPGDHQVRVCVTDDADTGCAAADVTVLSPEAALEDAIDQLAAMDADPAVAAALADLDGTANSQPGALERLEQGDLVAALTKIRRAIQDLEESDADTSDAVRTLVLLAESVARDQLAIVGSLGLTSRGDLRQLDRIERDVADGRALFVAGDNVGAVTAYRAATQRALSLQ